MTDSTNLRAKELVRDGAEHGTVVVADSQTAGRGRRGRIWESEDTGALYMSLILRPKCQPESVSAITLVAALAVSEAISKLTGMECRIKWPNDIVCEGKKVCGILTEMSLNGRSIESVIVGIGVNVNNTCFSDELQEKATSLHILSHRRWKKEDIEKEILVQLEYYYTIFSRTWDMRDLTEVYHDRLLNRNKQVQVLEENSYTGMAFGIDMTGALLVQTENGIRKVAHGEVSVRGLYGYV